MFDYGRDGVPGERDRDSYPTPACSRRLRDALARDVERGAVVDRCPHERQTQVSR